MTLTFSCPPRYMYFPGKIESPLCITRPRKKQFVLIKLGELTEQQSHSEGSPTKTFQHKTSKSYFAFLKSMQLEMKDPESIHSFNTEAVIGN